MTTPFDISFGACHVALANQNADGTISVPANNTPVLVATIPTRTGLVALDIATLFAQGLISYDAVTNDGAIACTRRRDPLQVVRGHSSSGSMSFGDTTYAAPELRFESNTALGNYFYLREVINGSGDVEISLEGISGGAKPMTFRNLIVTYRIFGSK